MNEIFPLERASLANDDMVSGKDKFRCTYNWQLDEVEHLLQK
jgi:hypothetical protein